MSDAPEMQEHEIMTYERTHTRLVRLKEEMTIKTSGALTDALARLSCVPFVSFPIEHAGDSLLIVCGEESGSLVEPNVEVIMKHSKPSPFGRGEKTVMDETYRRGREIVSANIELTDRWRQHRHWLSYRLESFVSATLFVPLQVTAELYKLAVYREGGHFDWHRDTTHSDKHHATVLVALNTSWTGGDFILRRNGVETRVDMKPKPSSNGRPSLQAVAFYTDTEHKVEPVTDGVRIILQYDIEVKGWTDDKIENSKKAANDKDDGSTKPGVTADTSDDDMSDDDDDDDKNDLFRSTQSELYNLETQHSDRERVRESASLGDPEVGVVLDIIRRLLDGQDEIAFALQYLYRKSSILPEFLKGSDSLVYQALSKTFDISLHPVMLHETTELKEDSYSDYKSRAYACKFDHGVEVDYTSLFEGKKGKSAPTVFHVPRTSSLMQISQHDFVDNTGNEATAWDNKYFGGGMFVKRKGTSMPVGDA